MSFPEGMLSPLTEDEVSPVFAVAFTTKEEQIERDPFNGNGVRLDYPGTLQPDVLTDMVLDLFGLPCCAWDCCAWVDLTNSDLSPDDIRDLWEQVLTPAQETGGITDPDPDPGSSSPQ